MHDYDCSGYVGALAGIGTFSARLKAMSVAIDANTKQVQERLAKIDAMLNPQTVPDRGTLLRNCAGILADARQLMAA